ncbi:MAG: rhomboid family intramembrane serine protease [Muribaculaceae bacterium]|nr:rhomboid family intramembrane serine protease [Muribaculaceae bacterium]MBP5315206.1 rhomboid family intramembrane serine protease [Muribaculaceae bacterium]MBR5435306.1 rhomboid family intramembrane serine protease [Muribaculaceae bacterium]MBR5744143.1 rhomboid family intramembrane serine protease [Muribaculaceae bacterium]
MSRGNSFFSNIPPVTKHLIIINFICWLASIVFASRIDFTRLFGLHFFLSPDFNVAQLVTYMFLHDTNNIAHIFFNMFTLFMFGITLERALGWKRFLFYYLSCGIGAALFQEVVGYIRYENVIGVLSAADVEQIRQHGSELLATGMNWVGDAGTLNMIINVPTIGASGAVYGVLLAFAFIFPNMPLYIMFIPIPIKAKWMVIGYGAIELLLALSTPGDGVAHFCHLGGMLFGLLMLLYWKKKGIIDRGNYFY